MEIFLLPGYEEVKKKRKSIGSLLAFIDERCVH